MASRWSLPPQPRAAFATTARLLSALVTESLLAALYAPVCSSCSYLTGVAVVLNTSPNSAHAPFLTSAIFAVVPLRDVPILKPEDSTAISLLDPLDMLPFIYVVHGVNTNSRSGVESFVVALVSSLAHAGYITEDVTLMPSPGPVYLWNKYADAHNVHREMHDAITTELDSSLIWQRIDLHVSLSGGTRLTSHAEHAYEHPLPTPTFGSPSIAWEQCIIEGHPTHPVRVFSSILPLIYAALKMHKARTTLPPIPPVWPGQYNWSTPCIRFVAVPRVFMNMHGQWDDLLVPLLAATSELANTHLVIPHGHVLIPVHEVQLPNIHSHFPEAHILPPEFSINALAQQCLRTVLLPEILPAHALKLPLGIRLTSAIRTISPASAHLSACLCSTLLPLLTYDRTLLIVSREPASAFHSHPDPDIAKHLAGIIRETYESAEECIIVCTALSEVRYEDEIPLAQSLFGLDTEAKRLAWLDTYITLLLRAFLPPLLTNGFAFEAHAQNTLARFSIVRPHTLTGFIIRDFGGVRIHAPTLLASIAPNDLTDLAMPGHAVMAETLDDVHMRLYHALVHNHLQHLIRVLRLHYNGKGWEILRRELRDSGHGLWDRTILPGKCFMRMRMGCTDSHVPIPNLIHYKGDGRDDEKDTGG